MATLPYKAVVAELRGTQELAYNPDGTLASITKTFLDGTVVVKSFTYTDSTLTGVSDWEVV